MLLAIAFEQLTTHRTGVLVVRLSVYLVLVFIPPRHATLIGAELFGLPVRLLGQRRSALQATGRAKGILTYRVASAKGLHTVDGDTQFSSNAFIAQSFLLKSDDLTSFLVCHRHTPF